MFDDLITLIRDLYRMPTAPIPLHSPAFTARDKELVLDAIDSSFVSSVGQYVDRFEQMLAEYTGVKRAVATVNGTCSLQAALRLVGVQAGDEVITQPLTFVATANAIVHAGAEPVFVDVDRDTMGMSPADLEKWLSDTAILQDSGAPRNKRTNRLISAIVPMHTFGHPCRIIEIMNIARRWSIPVVEDAAEALGSWVGNRHCGTFGNLGILSFNGNKTITCGGGGAILTNDEALADRAKHVTTTAKLPHPWEYDHNEIGYNYRLPNLNAALACAQMERLVDILNFKRKIAMAYKAFFDQTDWARFLEEPKQTSSNYWLCSIAAKDRETRENVLQHTNNNRVMARPAWKLMTDLPMFSHCQTGTLDNAQWLYDRVVNLPSGINPHE